MLNSSLKCLENILGELYPKVYAISETCIWLSVKSCCARFIRMVLMNSMGFFPVILIEIAA